MKKSLLTFVLLAFVIVAGAANQAVSAKKVTARPHKTAPVSLTQLRKLVGQPVSKSLKAPRKDGEVVKDTIDLTFTSSDFTCKWFEGDDASFWYFGCFDDSGNWVIRLAYNTEEQYGTVNYEDMNQDYSYLTYSNEDDEETSYKEITYQEGSQVNITNEDGYIKVNGCLLGADGKVYRINANCMLPLPETYEIEGAKITMAEYDDYWQQWDVRFKDADSTWKINLSLKSEDGHFAGTWTIDDASEDGCFASNLDKDEDYAFTEMTVTTTLPEGITDPSQGCEITGTAKDADGNTYNFHMKKDAPLQPKEIKNIEVEVTTAEWPSERTGGSYYELTEKDNPQNQWILSLTEKTGECTSEELSGIDTTATYRIVAGEEVHMNNGTINQTFDAEKLEVAVEAALVMNDSIQYNFTFTTPVSKDGEQTLTFTDLQVDHSYSEYGPTDLNASNDSIIMSAEITDFGEIPGEYTSDNFNIGLDIYKDGMSEYVSSNAIVYAKTELAEDGTAILHAKFLGDNKIIYTIEANYVKPEVKDTINITWDSDVLAGSDEAGYYFYHEAETQSVWVKVMCGQNSPVGHYTITDLNENSVVAELLENGMPKSYYLSEADLNVTREGKVYTLSGTCQAGPHFVYLTMKYEIEGLQYDDYENDVDVTYSQNDLVEITLNEEDEWNKYVYVKLLNKERNDELCLVVFQEEFNGATLAEGDYDITSWGWGNYVQAGQPTDEGIYPSYYAKLDAEGGVQTPLWFLTAGKMSVTEGDDASTSFEINAQNSYGQKVHATFSIPNTATGINAINADTMNANAFKFIKNGNIIIRKSGVEYNVAGERK